MMKKGMLLLLLAAVMVGGLMGQDSPVLMTIGDEKVSLEEFERIFRKNNSETSLNRQTPEEYLELYINFKLKVKEAESLGMDTTAKFLNELEGYRRQLAKPYLVDEEDKEKMMKEAYAWSKYDIKASHILIRLPESPVPEDTLAAYEKMMVIRSRILGGEDFESVARATSEDESVRQNGGNLNYFTVFSMVYPFERVAFNTPVGQLSMPFRTDYGYHILMVHDKRPARGQVKVAHIFVRTPRGMNEEGKLMAYQKVQMVFDSLKMGEDFGELARHHSEDPASAREGGSIPWFGTGRMISEFEDACFAIEKKGEYSLPFKTFYGWHIVKLIDKQGIGTYEEMKPELQQKINGGGRMNIRTERFVQKLQKEYGFSAYPEALAPIYQAVDSTLLVGQWKSGTLKELDSELMKIGDHVVETGEFVRYLETKQNSGKSINPMAYVDMLYKEFTSETVMGYEESRLPEKYPEFRYIYEEYHDGILLFDIMDQKIWTRAVADSAGLESYHKEHRKDYMWEERTEAYLVSTTGEVDMAGVRSVYKKIMKGKLDQEDLNEKYCSMDTVPCITLSYLLVEEGVSDMVDARNGTTGPGPVTENGDKQNFVIVKGVRSPQAKKLDDARGQVTSDYQEFLESEWIMSLKEKYPVSVDRNLLANIKI
jgi:peptidyl-prolyl cis-trans isomerase SurA